MTVVATTSAALKRNGLPGHLGMELSFGLAAVCFIPFGRRGRILRNVLLSVTGLILVVGMIACGGGGSNSNNNNNNFTPLSGTVTVQGMSGSLSHNVIIPVTIN